jgi:hypothetical protein
MVELFPALGNKNLSGQRDIFAPAVSQRNPLPRFLSILNVGQLSSPLAVDETPQNDKGRKATLNGERWIGCTLAVGWEGLLPPRRQIDPFDVVERAKIRIGVGITLGDENGIGQAECRKTKKGGDDEENFAKSKRMDAN